MNERDRKKIQEINERWAKKEENKPKNKHPWKKQNFNPKDVVKKMLE